MPINPNIPLQVNNDLSQGIGQLSSAIKFSQERDLKERQLAGQEQSNKQTSELNDLKIQQIRSQIEESGKLQSFEDMARDAVQVRTLLSNGNVNEARTFAIDRMSQLNERRKTDPSVNTVNTEAFINTLDTQGPEAALKMVEQEIQGLSQLGFIGREGSSSLNFSPKTTILENGGSIQATGEGPVIVKNALGEPVFGEERKAVLREHNKLKNEKGIKSQAEVEQIAEIERLKTEAKRNEAEEKLKFEKLQAEIDAKKLNVAEGEIQKEKAAGLKAESLRIVDELLKDPDAIRSVVGPTDSSIFSPTLFPSSLRAQTGINQLKSILTAENLGIMSGVLSETDIKIIAAIAGGGLDVGGDDEAFIQELTRMREKLSAQVDNETPTVNSQEEYDALPSGKVYIEDGQRFTKP